MMNWKKWIAVTMTGVLMLSFAGCSSGDTETAFIDEYVEGGEEITAGREESKSETEVEVPEIVQKEEEPKEEEEKGTPVDTPDEKAEKEEQEDPKNQPETVPETETNPQPETDPQPEAEVEYGPLYTYEESPYKDSLKILAIGNSFSNDGVEYLWDIANSMGIKEVVVGNLYISNCSLDKHYANMAGNAHSYRYYKNTTGRWETTEEVAISTALQDEKWDIITLQQASGENTTSNTYKKLEGILRYLGQRMPKEETKILWHMTWADQADSTKKAFEVNYGKDQIKMYEDVLLRIGNDVLIHEEIDGVIPVGTAIQNVRKTSVGIT